MKELEYLPVDYSPDGPAVLVPAVLVRAFEAAVAVTKDKPVIFEEVVRTEFGLALRRSAEAIQHCYEAGLIR